MNDLTFSSAGRILVVDDSESNRYVLATWLRRAGHTVVEARTGKEALQAVEVDHIDLVVLDVNLPDMSGYDVCEHIKARPASRSMPVLHVSATATATSDRSEGLRRGADGYLVEPLEREELVASVEALLRGASAQRTATRLAQRLRRLNDATLAVNEAETFEELFNTVVREACKLFNTTSIVAAVHDDGGRIVSMQPSGETTNRPCSAAFIQTLRTVATQEELKSHLSIDTIVPQGLRGLLLAADISAGGGEDGVVFIEFPDESLEGAMADETEIVLNQFARATGTAMRNMRTVDIERHIALTLQQALLPDTAPAIPGLDVATRYKASAEHAEVGGDFYEIFALDGDRVVVAIGDVVGHSLEAAAVMVQLRTGIRSYALEGHGPAAIIERLNGLLLRFHVDVTATVCCAMFTISTGVCEIANAGHPPALIVTKSGTSFAPLGGPILGIAAPGAPAHQMVLNHGDVLLLFTDGLVERRNETIDNGLDRLAATVKSPVGWLGELCDVVLQTAGPENPEDDIALVAIRPTNPTSRPAATP